MLQTKPLTALCLSALLLVGCGGSDGTQSTTQTSTTAGSQEVNSLQVRGPLQAKQGNQLTVMGQIVTINENTRLVGESIENLSIGDVLSITGTRQGGIIISVEIRLEIDQISHIVVGTPDTNELGQYIIGNLQLNFLDNLEPITGNTEYIFEGLFDNDLISIDISQIIEQSHGGNTVANRPSDSLSSSSETGDRLALNLAGDATCATTGDINIYQLLSIELTPDFRTVSRDISAETSVNPFDDTISVDSISDQGIGLRFVDQGITEVEFVAEGDRITRYFAALNANAAKPALLKSTHGNQCAFAYFPANNSGCAIAVNGLESGNGVSISSSDGGDGGDGGSEGRTGISGQDGISVVNDGGTIRFGEQITISGCDIQSTNGVSVITIER